MQHPLPDGPHRARISHLAIAIFTLSLQPLIQATPGLADGLDRIRGSGKLTLGYMAEARPFSYRDERGNAAGYTVALCQKIAEQIKTELGASTLTVEWVPVAMDDRLRAIQQRSVDFLCGADSVTLTRRKEVGFSIPIFPSGIGALLRTDTSPLLRAFLAEAPSPARPVWRGAPAPILESKTFSVVARTTGERWLAERLDKFQITAKVAVVDNFEDGIRRVLDRSSDVFFGDRPILLDAARRSPSAGDLIVLDRHFTYEPLAIALERGNEDLRLVADRTLSRMYGSREFLELYAKWFGEPDESALTFFRLSALPN